jgi:hypothetical protein
MPMRWRPDVMILALVAGTSPAYGADPLKSAECGRALDALQTHEAALLSLRRTEGASAAAAEKATLETYRKRAARECLGKEEPAPVRTARPPVVVSPITLPPSAVPPPAATPPPPVQVPAPRTVTQCDPSGCWTSDGIRLNRIGPLLVGPPGACTVQSGVLTCR